jgi:hypothetical protein
MVGPDIATSLEWRDDRGIGAKHRENGVEIAVLDGFSVLQAEFKGVHSRFEFSTADNREAVYVSIEMASRWRMSNDIVGDARLGEGEDAFRSYCRY